MKIKISYELSDSEEFSAADTYQLVGRVFSPSSDKEIKKQHALLGLASEVGEILGIYQKEIQGHPVDREHLLIEIGDALWMLAELLDSQDMKMSEAMNRNLEKLWNRYPNGFEVERSLHRAGGDI